MNETASLFAGDTSQALLTDLYELTMAYGYWKSGKACQESVFQLTFRKHPFHSGFTIAAGLAPAIDFLCRFRFSPSDLDYLSTIPGNDGKPLFEKAFLDYLGAVEFNCDLDAIPEGTVVFPHEPLLRIRGPILQCQIVEAALLNLINFQSLVATKAARICMAARGEPVVEFGLRRAQGIDGGLGASRAAYIGGCTATSNVLAGKMHGIPVKGTHAHSWIMTFDGELEAFEAWAEAMPNNCVFLVDTYDSLEGVRRAVQVARRLRAHGHEMVGVRLDSGDLAWLSVETRKILDEAGFPKALIMASNELDEHVITSLKDQGAAISIWGVGTKLITAFDDPALGGVYKLSAIRGPDGRWEDKIKLSEQAVKITNPGILQVRRFRIENEFIGDAIFDCEPGAPDSFTIVDPLDPTRRKHISPETAGEDLLVPVFRAGKMVYRRPSLHEIRSRTQAQLSMFHSGIKRFLSPHQYPVGLELGLYNRKTELILRLREMKSAGIATQP